MGERTGPDAVAIVGLGAILPDARDVATFWENVTSGRYSISDVPPSRWDPDLYYDPDPEAPDKSYSRIGGWVREFEWDPLAWRLPIPPAVSEAMDPSQRWAIACTRAALSDYGYPSRPLDPERTGVILGNALAGELHYLTATRIMFPELAEELAKAPSFISLPDEIRRAIIEEMRAGIGGRLPRITEDTMPGELANVIAGRVANLFNFRGPNFVADAACASAMAAMSNATSALVAGDVDACISGGIDRNMGIWAFVKFCKIGALSATGTRPYAEGADGFVMGEGAGVFLLKRLADAERDGDQIYAVVRALAGSSDGRGKGITAPNPIGQRLAVERAWQRAGLSPATATYIEGHGTSTRVGDVVEVSALTEAFGGGIPVGSIALGSVKSNIGHLKAASGAAGILKTVLALHHGVLPPSINFTRPNPDIDFAHSPFRVNTEAVEWARPAGGVRRAGVSAFGFGGTNFHAVLEEHVDGATDGEARRSFHVSGSASLTGAQEEMKPAPDVPRAPLRGAVVLGAPSVSDLVERLRVVSDDAARGVSPPLGPPMQSDLDAAERITIDFADAADLASKASVALRAVESGDGAMWKALRARGIFRGSGPAPRVAFLYPGQGSQYADMLGDLRDIEPVVAETFAEADVVMTPLLGGPLSDLIFVDRDDPGAVAGAEEELKQTAVTQPAVLAVDAALTRLLAEFGVAPDMVMGHSLGEYGALVAAGALSFGDALEAVSARGREMANLTVGDPGLMAAVLAPLRDVERIVSETGGYVVIANINSTSQSVIGGASEAVTRAVERCIAAGFEAIPLPVSHAFHTSIVAPASEPLRAALTRLSLRPPSIPVVANVDAGLYPTTDDENAVPRMLDILAAQVASPVRFIDGLRTLHDAGVRLFVEVGPKRALQGFVDDVLADDPDVTSLFTNHPKVGDVVSFNQALCGLWAAGLGRGVVPDADSERSSSLSVVEVQAVAEPVRLLESAPSVEEPVVITGAALGLPGTERIFDDRNIGRILAGEQLIDHIPDRLRQQILDRHITRLVKRENGEPTFELIEDPDDVIKLAGRGGAFDLEKEFGVDADRIPALDRSTRLAIGAGIDALRDAGIPFVRHYRTTSKGTQLPEGWALPEAVGDDMGVIFASAFPGLDAFAEDLTRYHEDAGRRRELEGLVSLRARVADDEAVAAELDRRIHELRASVEREPYRFDRRFLFKCLSMGHSQFAELIRSRGPNTQVNSACASTTQAVALAQDWIRGGRCRRVAVVAADDATSDSLIGWILAGFLASGAAATDDVVADAAIPFDRRRHGMVVGMGAAALIVESAEAARERGVQPICQVLSSVTANSAFHGSRLDVSHISRVMEQLISEAERTWGIDRHAIAPEMVFVSHETYTPARGGSAAAEVEALRAVFGADADRVVVANTKGFTGHPMGVGIEDVVAVKALETGVVPPVPNFREVDPDLGRLNLSQGGAYPVRYALRLAAGFGSQISMTLLRWTPGPDGTRRMPDELGFDYRIVDRDAWTGWLESVTGRVTNDLEVVDRRLRVAEAAVLSTPPAPTVEAPAEPEQAPMAAQPVGPTIPSPSSAEDEEEGIEPSSIDEASVRGRVLSLVAEKTGYPEDMLDLDLDMEADLGVDTVKQAEIFATIREEYGIERDETLKLRDYPTLAHVIGFVMERAHVSASAPAEPVHAESMTTSSMSPGTDEEVAKRSSIDEEGVRERVLGLVAAKTGYPEDMLDLDLDMEADLGVDTVKQAEIFATIREEYGIERDETLKLRDYPTLARVIGFVIDRAHVIEPEPTEEPEPSQGATTIPMSLAPDEERATLPYEAADLVPRRVPVPVLRPPIEFCRPTGVSIAAGSRVAIGRDRAGVADALGRQLEAMGAEVLMVDPAIGSDQVADLVAAWTETGPVTGVVWLPAMDDEGPFEAMTLDGWRAALAVRVKAFAAAMRVLADHVGPAGTFLLAGTRLGGHLGLGSDGATLPLGGAVAGFTKALGRERPDALVKIVDFPEESAPDEVAAALIEEALRDRGAVEIGRRQGLRWTIALQEQAATDGNPGVDLGPDSVFVVTGAAGSIVSAIVADLAAASGGAFHLLDLAAQPDPSDPDLERFASDRDGLKRDLVERIKAKGERATPAMVERELAGLERRHAALSAIRAIQEAGGSAVYHQVDLTDGKAVAEALRDVAANGRVDVLLHAAGLEISHLLPDKPQREFDLVFDVKSDGWFNVLHALAGCEIGATVAFSSVAGRFGNTGQTDYSAANALLCACTSAFRRTRPSTRGIAIDWTAWGGIGMATRGSIPKMMEAAGIDLLSPEAGVPTIRRELCAGATRGEIVVAGALGSLLEEREPDGGIDAGAFAAGAGVMAATVRSMTREGGQVTESVLDPAVHPFLNDHRIDGVPVLPGVMGIEAFAEAALLALPGWHIESIDDVRFLAPFKFYRDEPRAVRVEVVHRPDGDGVVAECRLTGARVLAGSNEPQVTTHFTGRVRPGRSAERAVAGDPRTNAAADARSRNEVTASDLYRIYFHGPAYQVLDAAWRTDTGAAGRFAAGIPADRAAGPLAFVLEPRLIELCFQTAGVWDLGRRGRLALPESVGRIVPAMGGTAGSGSCSGSIAMVEPHEDGTFDAEVRDPGGEVVLHLERYATVDLPGSLEPDVLEPLRRAMV